jgi:hypothetical protein
MLAPYVLAAAVHVLIGTTGGPVSTGPSAAPSAAPASPLEGEVVYTNASSPYFVLDGELHALPTGGQPTNDYRSLYSEPGRIKLVSATQTGPMPLGDQYLSVTVKTDARTRVPFLVIVGTAPNPLEKDTTVIVRPLTPAGIAQFKFAVPTETTAITCNPGPTGFPPPSAQIGTGALPAALTKC